MSPITEPAPRATSNLAAGLFCTDADVAAGQSQAGAAQDRHGPLTTTWPLISAVPATSSWFGRVRSAEAGQIHEIIFPVKVCVEARKTSPPAAV